MIKLPAGAEASRVLVEAAFSAWAPKADVELTTITPGHSGAGLYKADVRNAGDSHIRSGQYILKLSPPAEWAEQELEFKAHQRAFDWNNAFSKDHIPSLIEHFPHNTTGASADAYAMLFEIAGGSLDRYSTTAGHESGLFYLSVEAVLQSILPAWANAEVGPDKLPNQVIERLCGYRLDKDKAPSLHALSRDLVGDGLHFVVGAEVLISPLRFVDLVRENGCSASPLLEGLMHGDLHGGNILVHRMLPLEHPFWVIDFAMSEVGPVGYDAAYLELSQALAALGDENPTLLIGALRSAEDKKDRSPLPNRAVVTRDLIVKMRNNLHAWRDDNYPYRVDEIDRQLALGRVAAGINWANKPLKESWRQAALCYAGWAARQYLMNHQPKLWSQVELGGLKQRSKTVPTSADQALWAELWRATNGFSVTSGKYVLVAERLDATLPLRALGQLPWSAVIDLDPASDSTGLHRQAAPLLAARRGLHVFTSAIPTVDLRRGAAWMMAAGWAAKSEYFPEYNEWRWERLPVIRDFVRSIAETTSPEPVHVIVLPGATLDASSPMARLSSIVGTIDEASRGRAHVHLLGGRPVTESAKHLSQIPLTPELFLNFVANAFGTTFSAQEAQIPGPEGQPRTIPLEALRTMQENLHVLHSSILDESSEPAGSESEFWRGRPPTWAELHAGMDIERQVHRDLVRTLSERLDSYRTQTVVLDHSPGAGGTTAARRAAWELRSQYPVVVLHKNSPSLGTRVREIFNIAERPVLLVAEASDLTESSREDLYRYFSQNNCRVVLLYLRRTFAQPGDETSPLVGPMHNNEAKSFFRIYSDLTTDMKRRDGLRQITNKSSLSQYRFPFFYGLIAFEREFLGIETYVESHLVQVRKLARNMLEHLALATIYSNSGLSMALLKAMMGLDTQSPLTLTDMFGPGPARLLTVRGGTVRFMHQMIAEQVFTHFHGGGSADDWRLDLKTYAIEFIRDVRSAAEPEALQALLRQMFVDRSGGVDGVEDKEDFAPIIESLDAIDKTLGHAVLEVLAEECPRESHFWSHLGRHQIYRLRRDYEKAEEYLLRAITISPADPLHHHTFGLVLRSRLRHQLHALRKGADVEEVFRELDPLFDKAAIEFEETRRLSPENVYGYITHIQMVLLAARRLKDAAGADTIARVGGDHPSIKAWLQNNLAGAEQLLRDASHLYGTLEKSSQFLTECEADLNALYGDLDNVVALWEIADASGTGGAVGRRALANAYLARNNRRWSGLDLAELRRVVELMEINLRDSGRRDDDYELWFNAFIMLPEYDADAALSQLALWAKRYPSWRAHYYSYVLHFALWHSRRTDDVGQFDEALEECRKRHVGRRNRSDLWFGTSPTRSGFVSEADLGGWSRDLDFFSRPQALRRVNGIIDSIDGPQAGAILIDGRVRAFFVPGKSFSAHRDENAHVNFYLGFSPTGLRAWSVTAGRVTEGDRAAEAAAPLGASTVMLSGTDVDESSKWARIDALRRERLLGFARELILAKAKLGAKLTVGDLDERLAAVFADGVVAKGHLVGDLLNELRAEGTIQSAGDSRESLISLKGRATTDAEIVGTTAPRARGRILWYDGTRKFGFVRGEDGKKYWFSRDYVLPGYRKDISRPNVIVGFVAAEGDRGPVAQGITVLADETATERSSLSGEELRSAASEFIVSEVGRAGEGGLALTILLDRLTTEFRSGDPLERRLDTKSLGGFVAEIEGVKISGKKSALKVALVNTPAFGRLANVPTPSTSVSIQRGPHASLGTQSPNSANVNIETARTRAVSLVRDRLEKQLPINLANLGAWLGKEFPGEGTLARRLGYQNLKAFLASVDEISIGPEPHNTLTLKSPIDQT